MGDTTLTIDEKTPEKLEAHRGDAYDSWDDYLTAIHEILPDQEELQNGCAWCDKNIIFNGRIEEVGGVIRFFHTEMDGDDVYGSTYYCSVDCAKEAADEMDAMVPEEPDEVLVGGKSELQASFEGATFYLDRDTMEVGIPVPGAFDGTSSHGTEYDYIGEPVYIRNEGDIVQKGVIEDIIHEETHTALLLGHGHETVMLNHPDREKREEYKEQHAKWATEECAACGTEFQYTVKNPPEECPECGEEEW